MFTKWFEIGEKMCRKKIKAWNKLKNIYDLRDVEKIRIIFYVHIYRQTDK